ncbi:hypothetical protein ScPMuIL_012639 [Solemya velum]
MTYKGWILSLVCLYSLSVIVCGEITDELAEAQRFLDNYDAAAEAVYYKSSINWWNYNTNISDHNLQIAIDYSLEVAKFDKNASSVASQFNLSRYDDRMRRQLSYIVNLGTSAMKDETKLQRLAAVSAEMESIYSRATVRMDDGRELALEPGLTKLLATSRNYDELLEAWQKWRDVSGREMREKYEEFVELSNEAIRNNGYSDTGAYWRSWYETENFEQILEGLYEDIHPLYKELHTYTRRKLIEKYGEDKFPRSRHIPAHLLGNMWAQSWNNLLDFLQPYDKESVDVTPVMQRLNYTAVKMFELSDDFFGSLGLERMPAEFWNHSMIVKPNDRDVVCHASAWDFSNGKDFRIKQCTEITMDDLITVHHEMGHIEYYLLYKNQPIVFRKGANPGFHEAVGDVISLSVRTPKHLREIGLLQDITDDEESDINFLLSIALDRVAFIPFGYLIDQWRWRVFSGEITPATYNEKWWQLRCRYQGISPPVERTEEDFDPGAKYHIPGNTPYIRYFVSYILQFQLHDAVCKAAGHSGPLHKCDIYRSHEAGDLLRDVLSLGSSLPWPDALEKITGQRNMNASSMLTYFDPLYEWLKQENIKAGDATGWEDACPQNIPPGESTTNSSTGMNQTSTKPQRTTTEHQTDNRIVYDTPAQHLPGLACIRLSLHSSLKDIRPKVLYPINNNNFSTSC